MTDLHERGRTIFGLRFAVGQDHAEALMQRVDAWCEGQGWAFDEAVCWAEHRDAGGDEEPLHVFHGVCELDPDCWSFAIHYDPRVAAETGVLELWYTGSFSSGSDDEAARDQVWNLHRAAVEAAFPDHVKLYEVAEAGHYNRLCPSDRGIPEPM